jgi:hypothetical protein
MEKESRKCINTSYFPKDTQPRIKRQTALRQVTLAFYLFVRIQACSCASFLFLLFVCFFGCYGGSRNTIRVCKNTHWEWRSFEDLAHIEFKNRFFCFGSISYLTLFYLLLHKIQKEQA